MNLAIRSRRLAVALGVIALAASAGSLTASAQEIEKTHLAAARSALVALRATEEFDIILPSAAQVMKGELIQTSPDRQAEIIEVVDQMTLALAGRRADLEREAATIYARTFSETELNEIAAFYNSEPGKKLLEHGQAVTVEVTRAAVIWQNGIARDLHQQVVEELARRAGTAETTPPPEGEAQQ